MDLIKVYGVRLFLTCFVLHLSSLTASAQGFVWAQGNVGSSVAAVTTDGNNNGYFVGSFEGTVDFDPGPGVQNLTAVSDFDLFILKKDAAGNLLWAKQVMGTAADTGMCIGKGIGLDDLGNVYIGGSFKDTYDFDPGPGVHILGAYANGNSYSYNSFVLKLDPSGNFVWVKNIGSPTVLSNFSIQALKMDAAANIVFTCIFASNQPVTVDVDPGAGVHNVQCQTGGNVLIEKLDSAGNFIWADIILSSNIPGEGAFARALALDTANNIYITGQLIGTTDFDPGPGVANLSGSEDVFIAKYNSSGNYVWAGSLIGGWHDRGGDIATDTFGNILVSGYWGSGTVDFDPGSGVYHITSGYSHNGFLMKLRSNGTLVWAKTDNLQGGGTAITTDGEGNVYTTTSRSLFQKRDSMGNIIWFRDFDYINGNFNSANLTAVALDNANDIYLTGSINASPYDFDLGPGEYIVQGTGGGFIEKLCGTSLALAITANNDTICPQGDNVQISTPAVTGATYTWTCNGVVVGGNSNQIITSLPGIYEVYTDGGCPSASGPMNIYDCYGNLYDAAGVDENIKTADIEVYPNPFEDVLTVKGLKVNDQVSLTDITGRVVHRWQGATSMETFTINDISSGYYVLKVINENGVVRVNVPVVKR